MNENIAEVDVDVLVEEEALSGGEKVFVATSPQIPIASQGGSVEEATENFTEAFNLWIETASQNEKKTYQRRVLSIGGANR